MRLKYLLYIILSILPALAYGQKESGDVRRGNKSYNKEDYVEAEVDYRKGLDKNKESFEAHFNLGNALFKREKYADAIEQYEAAEQYAGGDKQKQASIKHNIGNAHFAQQQYGEAVESYKKSLKDNPKDNDTRYNLVKAMQMLEAQQQQQNQPQQQNKQDKQQQNQQDQQQQDQQQENQQQQENPSKIDKETAEQLLQALEQDEQETQEKVKRQESQSGRRSEKDW